MTLLTFRGYGVQASAVTIVAERVLSFSQIDFNGRYGTEIHLDRGLTVRVEEWPQDVKTALEKAQLTGE
ncbi:MAG: hypothetical protein CGU28_04240 [Candidatus Dactylopiibacterium carminicum]|nr:MAG: hypothetical protein CGU28_04240 [Candidatus Dactylopiibacterium carminicum]